MRGVLTPERGRRRRPGPQDPIDRRAGGGDGAEVLEDRAHLVDGEGAVGARPDDAVDTVGPDEHGDGVVGVGVFALVRGAAGLAAAGRLSVESGKPLDYQAAAF